MTTSRCRPWPSFCVASGGEGRGSPAVAPPDARPPIRGRRRRTGKEAHRRAVDRYPRQVLGQGPTGGAPVADRSSRCASPAARDRTWLVRPQRRRTAIACMDISGRRASSTAGRRAVADAHGRCRIQGPGTRGGGRGRCKRAERSNLVGSEVPSQPRRGLRRWSCGDRSGGAGSSSSSSDAAGGGGATSSTLAAAVVSRRRRCEKCPTHGNAHAYALRD